MAKKARVIEPESFETVMKEVAEEVKKILDKPPGKGEMAFTVYYNTLRLAVRNTFSYLPKGERDNIETMCAVWMDVGILLGKSPQLLVDILKRTRAKLEEIDASI